MTKHYNVTAKHWEQGWELYLDGECVTQVKTLSKAAQQVRDYLGSMYEGEFDDAEVIVRIDLEGSGREAAEAREATARAARAQEAAARQSRKVAAKLRKKGLSVSDTADVLGVSRGRVSQLTRA